MKPMGWGIGLATVILGAQLAAAGEVGITPKIGTLGIGGEVTVGLGSLFNLRAGYNGFNYDRDFDMDEAEVRGRARWSTIPILLDWHVFEGGFRISAGGVINNNRVAISAIPNQTLRLQDTDYEVDSLDGSIDFNRLGYYAGIGYGNAVGQDGHWHFACDFGVMNHGEPKVSASAVARDPAIQSALNDALAREVADYQDDVRPYQWYPVISVGVSFTF